MTVTTTTPKVVNQCTNYLLVKLAHLRSGAWSLDTIWKSHFQTRTARPRRSRWGTHRSANENRESPRRHAVIKDDRSYLWIWKRPKSVVVLLSCSVPQSEADGHAIAHHRSGVIVESEKMRMPQIKPIINVGSILHCGHVFPWKAVGCVWNKHACLAHCTIAHHDTLNGASWGHLVSECNPRKNEVSHIWLKLGGTEAPAHLHEPQKSQARKP